MGADLNESVSRLGAPRICIRPLGAPGVGVTDQLIFFVADL